MSGLVGNESITESEAKRALGLMDGKQPELDFSIWTIQPIMVPARAFYIER